MLNLTLLISKTILGAILAITLLLLSIGHLKTTNKFLVFFELLRNQKIPLFVASIICILIIATCEIILHYSNNKVIFTESFSPDNVSVQKATLSGFDAELHDMADEYKEKAKAYFIAGENDSETECYTDAIRNYRKSIETLPTMSAYMNLGASLFYTSDYSEAQRAFNSGLQIAKKKQTYNNYAGPFLANTAKIYMLIGKNSEALQYLDKALVLYKEIGDKRGEASTLMHFGILNNYLSNPESAINYYKQSSEIAEKIGFREISVGNLTNTAITYSELLEEPQKALKYHQKALEIHREMGGKQGEAISLGNIGLLHVNFFENPADALRYFQDALSINEEIGSKKGMASDIGNMGFVYQRQGKPKEALTYHQQALEINKEIGFKKGEAINLSNIGINYDNLGKHEEALKHHQKALEINRQIDFIRGEAKDLANIGVAYINLKNAEKALLFLNKSLAINKNMGYRRSEAIDISNIGAVHEMFLKRPLEAFNFFVKAIDINRKIGNKSAELGNLINIGIIYNGFGDYEKALKTYEEAILLADEINSPMDINDVREDIKNIKKKLAKETVHD